MNWQNKVSSEVKALVDIDKIKTEVEKRYNKYREEGNPQNFAAKKVRQEVIKLLQNKGIKTYEAVSLIHFCEGLPYDGCGCCEHRARKSF